MSGLSNLKLRLDYLGGADPIGRMNNGKLKTLSSALKSSYQSASIIKLSDGETYQCLINPDRVKADYDNKIISIYNTAGMMAGETFYWPANNTYWIVYLGELTETAYFRGYIRRCKYKFVINDNDYYAYVQGPTETDIKWNQKAGVTWNLPNYSLTMYITKTPDSLEYFQRFKKVEINGDTWEVEAIDSVSMEGIIEVNLGESFNNPNEDLQTLPIEPVVDPTVARIVGDVFVKPYDIKTYSIVLSTSGTWSLSNNLARIISSSESEATIEIVSGKSGAFQLMYSNASENLSLEIIIESL